MVPVSWPPCPASITMRPIFNPRARIRLRSPSAVGDASWMAGASYADAGDVLLLLPRDFLSFAGSGDTVTAVGAAVGFLAPLTPASPGLGKSSSAASSGGLACATVTAAFGGFFAIIACSLLRSFVAGVSDDDAEGSVLGSVVSDGLVEAVFAGAGVAVLVPATVWVAEDGARLGCVEGAFCSGLTLASADAGLAATAVCLLPLFSVFSEAEAADGAAFATYSSAATPSGGVAAICDGTWGSRPWISIISR